MTDKNEPSKKNHEVLHSNIPPPIKNIKKQESKPQLKEVQGLDKPEIVVMGDVHGELVNFKENLRAAKLVDSNNKWIANNKIFIQVGDIIDRGEQSKEAHEFIKDLQKQAKTNDSEVIRICGNHELMLLEGDFRYAKDVFSMGEIFEMREDIKNSIINGEIVAASLVNERVFTHAGLRSKIRIQLINEICEKKDINNNNVTNQMLVNYINELFVNAVKNNDYSHSIFQASERRGGEAEVGGIFWEDWTDFSRSVNAGKLKQVVGHTPERKKGDRIKHTDSIGRINVDVGLNEGYGGNQAFLVIRNNNYLEYRKINNEYVVTSLEQKNTSQDTLELVNITIGRAEDNDLQINDEYISRKHLKISGSIGNYVVEDLKSSNGSVVLELLTDSKKFKGTILKDGEKLNINTAALINVGNTFFFFKEGKLSMIDDQNIINQVKEYIVKHILEKDQYNNKKYQNKNDEINSNQWMPRHEPCPVKHDLDKWDIVDNVDMKSLPEGTMIYLGDTGTWVNYLIKIEKGNILKLWLNNSHWCYLGKYSLINKKGILKSKEIIGFPYFKYDDNLNLLDLSNRTGEFWANSFPFFRILYPK